MSKASRIVADALASLVHALKVTMAAAVAIGFVLMLGALVAATAPADVTYSNDEFTVANSSDGEQVVITYEVETTLKEDASKSERKQAMDTMAEVSACTNARLDGYIQDNSKERVENVNLEEITISCEKDGVSVERIQVAGGMV